MHPTYLDLAYEGNYVGKSFIGGEIFTYQGKVFHVYHDSVNEVNGLFLFL